MRRLAAATAVAAALALAFAPTTPAYADTAQPSAAFAGAVLASGDTAVVMIRYTCSSSASPINHLFVAVKQGPDVNATDHTTSAWAQTFYSSNWSADEGPDALSCDGRPHAQGIVVKPDIYWAPHHPGAPALSRGTALVQICVFDNITTFDPNTGEPLDGGFAPSYTMERVVTTSRG
jgi:hypothetical protein